MFLYKSATVFMSSCWDTQISGSEVAEKIFTVLIPLVSVVWFISLAKKQYYHNLNITPLPPGPRGLPLVGYLPFLGSELHRTFTNLAAIYGPIFKLKLGTKQLIVISSPSLVKEVVKDKDVIFANRTPTVAASTITYGGCDIAFSSYGHEWRKMRKIFISEMLSKANLDSSFYLMKQESMKIIKETYHDKAGKLVDVGALAFQAVTNSVMSMVSGNLLLDGDKSTEFHALVKELLELLGAPNISDFLPLLARFDLQQIRRRMKAISIQLERVFDSAIQHHDYGGKQNVVNGQQDFLGILLELTKHEDPAKSLNFLQVKSMLTDILVGGTDTTATTIEWAMAELLQHPETMKKVQEELTETMGLNNITVEQVHLSKLKYLNAVVKETLRLHPGLPLLVPHCPSKSTTIGGYTIPEGSQIFLNAWAIQRDPKLWENPLKFQPERFLEDKQSWGNDLEFFPFGSGRRMCAGIPLAERMLMLVLASLLHAFEWSLPNGITEVDLSDKYGIVTKKSKPLVAVPTPRLSRLELYSYKHQ